MGCARESLLGGGDLGGEGSDLASSTLMASADARFETFDNSWTSDIILHKTQARFQCGPC
jgi:hypothetical protein